MHEVYGLDLSSGVMRERTWRWFLIRLYGLLSADSRVSRHFAPPEPSPAPPGGSRGAHRRRTDRAHHPRRVRRR
ncbi:hypothetical protein C1N81_00410 (plasmid) [Streptomyces sp. SGAir0957]